MSLLWVLLILGLAAGVSAGDAMSVRIDQLRRAEDYKVRLSAAVWLAKKSGPRAIDALARALVSDPEHAVRRIAARSLGAVVTGDTPAPVRERAVKALQRAVDRDEASSVRRSARRSLRRLAALPPAASVAALASASSSKGEGGAEASGVDIRDEPDVAHVFVHVERPKLGKHRLPGELGEELQDVVKGVFRQSVPAYRLTWQPVSPKTGSTAAPGPVPEPVPDDDAAGLPTRAQLVAGRARGWLVSTSVSGLTVKSVRRQAEVRCTVAVQVNRWEGSDVKLRLTAQNTASATGSGKVSTARAGLARAKRDCVLTVAEELVARQVVPFLKMRNPETSPARRLSSGK